MIRRLPVLLATLFLIMGLAGCESGVQPRSDSATVEDRSTLSDQHSGSVSTSGARDKTSFVGSPLADPNSPLSVRVIYFDYDSSSVAAEYQETIRAHAEYLGSHQGVVLSLQGHADERGSREYNLALGERRSVAVQRLAVLLGAASGQVNTLSYGEEKPVAFGHEENSWHLNRRVELVY